MPVPWRIILATLIMMLIGGLQRLRDWLVGDKKEQG